MVAAAYAGAFDLLSPTAVISGNRSTFGASVAPVPRSAAAARGPTARCGGGTELNRTGGRSDTTSAAAGLVAEPVVPR